MRYFKLLVKGEYGRGVECGGVYHMNKRVGTGIDTSHTVGELAIIYPDEWVEVLNPPKEQKVMEKTKEQLIKAVATVDNLIEAGCVVVSHTDLLSKEKISGIKKEIKTLKITKTILEGELMRILNKENL